MKVLDKSSQDLTTSSLILKNKANSFPPPPAPRKQHIFYFISYWFQYSNNEHIFQAQADSVGGDRLYSSGWAEKVTNLEDGSYLVPSEFTDGISYSVNIAECSCTCGRGSKSVMCKHIHLVRKLQIMQHPGFGTLSACLASHCEYLHTHPDRWKIVCEDSQVLEVNIPQHEYKAYATATSCTCPANSFFCECSHVLLSRKLFTDDDNPDAWFQSRAVRNIEQEHEMLQASEMDTSDQHPSICQLKAVINQLEGTSPSTAVCSAIQKLHDKVFKTSERDNSKRVKPLHPYRKLIRTMKEKDTEATCAPPSCTATKSAAKCNDHTMSKKPSKERMTSKNDFHVRDAKTSVKRSSNPSIKTLVRRNQRQSEQVTFLGLVISRAAMDYIDVKVKCKPVLPVLLKPFTTDMICQVRMLSHDTLKDITDEKLFEIFHSHLFSSQWNGTDTCQGLQVSTKSVHCQGPRSLSAHLDLSIILVWTLVWTVKRQVIS